MKAVKSAQHLLMALLFCLILAVSSLAASGDKSIRVGYFTQPYYQDVSISGGKSGYGYELLERLSQYTHWEYEYVQASWSDCLDMLARGELDLVGSAMKTPQREALYDFAQVESGISYGALCVRRGNTAMAYEDFAAFDGMTVGVIAGSGRIAQLEQYCSENDFTVETAFYTDERALSAALLSGQVDAILAGNQRRSENEWVVARFAPTPFYFMTTKGNTAMMDELNAAQLQLRIDAPTYMGELYNRYYGATMRDTPLFTRAEIDYIANQPPLRCLYNADWRPLSYTDADGNFAGVLADVFGTIQAYTGLEFQFIPYTGKMPLELVESGQIDLVCGYEQECNWDQTGLLQLTDPYLSAPNVLIRNIRDTQGPLILPANRFSPSQFLQAVPRDKKVVYAATETDCLNAVRRGEASVTYLNTHVANFLLQRAPAGSLNITSMEANRDDLCIGVAAVCDPMLLQILNNAIGFISDAHMSQIITNNATLQEELSVLDFLNLYPTAALGLAVTLLFAVIFFLCVVLFQRSHSNRKIYGLLYLDDLTGAWNLNKFRIEATKLLADHPMDHALLYADIEHFKSFNETYGYAKSDQILKTISDVVRRSLRNAEIFARMSADQFVALLRVVEPAELPLRLAALNESINEALELEQNVCRVALITGICFPGPTETDVSHLIDCANEARKSVKGSHKSIYAVYDESMRRSRQLHRELEATMDLALRSGNFVAYYQPKYQIATHQIVGAEALARWIHPVRGMIPPCDFIPLFERNGFVTELDFYIYEQVCIMLRRWLDMGLPVVPISTNFSRVDLAQKDFCARLKAIANRHRIAPYLLELELTESAVAESSDQLVDLSAQLKEMGFLLSMDDFGSGYSSLNLLKKLPVDTLKLDKEFLHEGLSGDKERILIEGFVDMAHRMNMLVVCEGVELAEQARFLAEIGCKVAQGYLYAHPMPEREFERILHVADQPIPPIMAAAAAPP